MASSRIAAGAPPVHLALSAGSCQRLLAEQCAVSDSRPLRMQAVGKRDVVASVWPWPAAPRSWRAFWERRACSEVAGLGRVATAATSTRTSGLAATSRTNWRAMGAAEDARRRGAGGTDVMAAMRSCVGTPRSYVRPRRPPVIRVTSKSCASRRTDVPPHENCAADAAPRPARIPVLPVGSELRLRAASVNFAHHKKENTR
jgi:hypothetical protein